MHKMYWRYQKGAALPLAVMLVFVLSLLGTALWQYSATDTLHASRFEKSTQAYYLARSGAESLTEYIASNPDNREDMADFVDQLVSAGESVPTDLGSGSFKLEVNRNPEDASEIFVVSTGEVDGVRRTATLTVTEHFEPLSTTPLEMFFEYAIYSYTDLALGGNIKVYVYDSETNELAEVAAGENINVSGNAASFAGEENEGVQLSEDLVSVNFPDDLADRGSLSVTGGSHVIDENGYYSSISLSGNSTLTLATGGQDDHLVIRAGSFEMTGNKTQVKISGGGKVFFYVDEDFTHNSGTINPWGTEVNGQAGPTPSQFILLGPKTISFGGNAVFVGYIYSVEEVEGFGLTGTPTIYGAVIFGSASDFGNATVYYIDPTEEGNDPIGEQPDGSGETTFESGSWR